MKKLFYLIVILIAISCNNSNKLNRPDDFYRDIDLRIVSINSQHRCTYILFESISEIKTYQQINTCDLECGCNDISVNIDRDWIRNHKEGDIVHFEYLRKEKFVIVNHSNPK